MVAPGHDILVAEMLGKQRGKQVCFYCTMYNYRGITSVCAIVNPGTTSERNV